MVIDEEKVRNKALTYALVHEHEGAFVDHRLVRHTSMDLARAFEDGVFWALENVANIS